MRLLLVRHGVTTWNEDGRYQGHTDVPLGHRGRAQAARLGERLRREAITAAYASDLSRAAETAAIALAGRGVALQQTTDLRETCFGEWEGQRAAEIATLAPEAWAAWSADPLRVPPPGGETVVDLRNRVVRFYERVMQAHTPGGGIFDRFAYRAAGGQADVGTEAVVLLVAHGGPIRALLTHLLACELASYWRFGIRPASLSVFDVYPEGAISEVIGDTAHLD